MCKPFKNVKWNNYIVEHSVHNLTLSCLTQSDTLPKVIAGQRSQVKKLYIIPCCRSILLHGMLRKHSKHTYTTFKLIQMSAEDKAMVANSKSHLFVRDWSPNSGLLAVPDLGHTSLQLYPRREFCKEDHQKQTNKQNRRYTPEPMVISMPSGCASIWCKGVNTLFINNLCLLIIIK